MNRGCHLLPWLDVGAAYSGSTARSKRTELPAPDGYGPWRLPSRSAFTGRRRCLESGPPLLLHTVSGDGTGEAGGEKTTYRFPVIDKDATIARP